MVEGAATPQPHTRRRRGDAIAAASAAALARLRVAGDDDNARVLDLMGDVPMEGNLSIATERDPDFFALYRLQRGDNRLWVYDSEDGGPLKGMGGVLVRSGYLDDVAQPVGYLGDLRTRGVLRERLAFPDVYAHLFQRTIDETGCQAFLTGILADNQAALRALSSSKTSRSAQPHYALLRRFDMANIHFVGRLPRRRRRGVTVSIANAGDVDAIVALLAKDHARRPFGWRFDDGEFQHRLAHWPGYSLDHTFVAKNEHGDVVGVVTCWDAAAVKRYRVQRYRGQMLWVKRALSGLAALNGSAPLPEVGRPFRYFYLCNLSVKDDNDAFAASVFAAIVDAVYAAYADAGFHFFAFPIFEGDGLAAQISGYMMRRMPFHLYAVTASSVARSAWPAGRPGFEMALA